MMNRYFQDTRAGVRRFEPNQYAAPTWNPAARLAAAPPVVPGRVQFTEEPRYGGNPVSPAPWGSLPSDLGHEPPGRGGRHRPAKGLLTWMFVPILAVLLAVLGGLGVAVQRANLLPVWVPVIGKDTGVALCEAIATKTPAKTLGTDSADDADKIREIRSAFGDSRYEAIRINGVKLMDLAVQIEALGDDPGLGALAYIGAFADAYAGLAGGCAEVGYKIPPMTSK